jgi:hypothetical protein
MSPIHKYLALSVLMTGINVPLYFYSKSVVQGHDPMANLALIDLHAIQAALKPHAKNSHAHAHDMPVPLEVTHLQEKLTVEDQEGRFASLSELYRPPLFGKCVKLFERYNRKNFTDKPHKAFVYQFDGEEAYCADAYTDKGKEAAEEIVLRECEEHHEGSGKYSPCRIYASE